jgi:hypothetical protein
MLLLLFVVEHPHEQVVATAARELSLFRFPSHRREGNWGHDWSAWRFPQGCMAACREDDTTDTSSCPFATLVGFVVDGSPVSFRACHTLLGNQRSPEIEC